MNARPMDPAEIADAPVRRFDVALTDLSGPQAVLVAGALSCCLTMTFSGTGSLVNGREPGNHRKRFSSSCRSGEAPFV